MPRQPEITVKVAADGRITIPKDACERLDLRPGDEVTVTEHAGGWQISKELPPLPTSEAVSRFAPWRGYLKHLKGRDVDELVEEMRGPAIEPELRS